MSESVYTKTRTRSNTNGTPSSNKTDKKGRIGRPGLYNEWLTEDALIRLRGWARSGLTDKQIAHNMGINPGTLIEWKHRFPKFAEALKKGKEVVDYEVENALYQSALKGNVTAQIFWLKNRKPVEWRDRQDVDLSGEVKSIHECKYDVIQDLIQEDPSLVTRIRDNYRRRLGNGTWSK